nr:acyltransferase [Mycolicibacterium vaccae]
MTAESLAGPVGTVATSGSHRAPAHPARTQFRPDIEGMRAIAVVLVILFHGYHQPFTGGFIGVDIFFVISGFLITSLLLRENDRGGRISIAGFYARRVRRILPASTVVVLVTLVATYHWLGFINGNAVAEDAKWTAIFSANVHFALLGTDYFGAQMPPSPLQHMWSLGVEEQFYFVWPAVFLVLVFIARGAQHRRVLAGVLSVIIVASLSWSVLQTAINQTWAYFSPLTRAWELALGALVAVLAPSIARLKHLWVPTVLAVGGLCAIAVAAFVLTPDTRYPGSAVILPVTGSAALIAAGCIARPTWVGRALSVRPMQWIGARSYSLYLWHWPLLIIPARYLNKDLSLLQATGLVALAVLASALTFRLVEDPIRRSKFLSARTGLSLAMGALLMAVTILAAQWLIASNYGSWEVFT